MNSDMRNEESSPKPTAEGSTITDKNTASTTQHPCFSLLSYYQEGSFSARSGDNTTLGTTLVADQFIPPGSLLFHLPLNHLITHDLVVATPLSKLIAEICAHRDESDTPLFISPEALTWLNMVVWLNDANTACFPTNYLAALSLIPPDGSSWPQSLRDELKGSNIYAILDASGDNNETMGNVSGAVNGLLVLLDDMRSRIKQMNEQETKSDKDDAAMRILCQEPSIFTHESINWARGHFLSRRFPDPRTLSENNNTQQLTTTEPKSHHLAGYGGKLSVLIPFMDLMNHSFDKKNTCTIQIVTSATGDGQELLEVRSGQVALQAGDELYYCYGEELSNEKLLQGYGFCVPNNPSDTISLKVTAKSTAASSCAFSIRRGGVSSIPKEMWGAIAGVVVDGHEGELEIGSGDLEQLLQYMTDKLEQLNSNSTAKEKPTLESVSTKEEDGNVLNQERLLYIEIYKKGQREILEELIRDIKVMLPE